MKIRYTQEKLEKALQRFVFWFRCHTHRLAFNFLKIFIAVELVYSVVLISAVQQSDSVIHTYIYIYMFFFIFFSIMVYHRRLNIVPI